MRPPSRRRTRPAFYASLAFALCCAAAAPAHADTVEEFYKNKTITMAIAYSVGFAQSVEDGPFQIQIVPTYSLTQSVTGQGIVRALPNLPRYLPRTSVTLTAYPAAGWRFLRWQGDVCGPSSGAIIVLDTNKTVTAVFEEILTMAPFEAIRCDTQ